MRRGGPCDKIDQKIPFGTVGGFAKDVCFIGADHQLDPLASESAMLWPMDFNSPNFILAVYPPRLLQATQRNPASQQRQLKVLHHDNRGAVPRAPGKDGARIACKHVAFVPLGPLQEEKLEERGADTEVKLRALRSDRMEKGELKREHFFRASSCVGGQTS